VFVDFAWDEVGEGMGVLIVRQIYVYPIKSLRGVKVTEALGTRYGFKHDRSFVFFFESGEWVGLISV
jgi:uncharacterized protein YcbX